MIQPNIISNPQRTVRVDRLHNEMKRQGIADYKMWPSVHIPTKPTRTAISQAHKQIVRWALIEELEEVCIFEDDIWFPAGDGFKYFIDNKPKVPYDLYLGGVARGKIDENKMTARYTGQFCYFIHSDFYTTFLSADENLDIDGAMSGLGKYFVCDPMAAFCYPGWSDNTHGAMNYNYLLVGREIRGFGKIENQNDADRLTQLANSMMPR